MRRTRPGSCFGGAEQPRKASGAGLRAFFFGRIMGYKALSLSVDTVERLHRGQAIEASVVGEGPLGNTRNAQGAVHAPLFDGFRSGRLAAAPKPELSHLQLRLRRRTYTALCRLLAVRRMCQAMTEGIAACQMGGKDW
jgi:hypothetical protein